MRAYRLSAVILLTGLLAACENPEQKANALFVEAAQALTDTANTTDPLQQYDQLAAAKQAISNIVADYPGSSAAVRISANEKIGPYSLAELDAALSALAQRPEFCLRALTRGCLTDIIIGNLEKLLKQDRSKDHPDETLLNMALSGLPFVNIVAQDKVQNLFANSPDGAQGNTELMGNSFGFQPITPLLLRMIGTAKGAQALTGAIATLNALPGFRDTAVKGIHRLAHVFLNPRRPQSAALLRAAVNAIMQPLPETAARELATTLCKLSTNAEENAIVTTDCTPAELTEGNTSFQNISADLLEQIYKAAPTPDKKLDVADNIFTSGLTLDQRIQWHPRTKYATSLERLTSLYVEATREGHRARPTIIAAIERAKDGTLDNAALTQAGVTPKNILLLHANGRLADQLPAIYQNIEAQPRYTLQLFNVLKVLALLQPLTVGMEQMPFFTLVGKTTGTWPDEKSASSDSIRTNAFNAYPSDADPRPAYELLYPAPYHQNMDFDLLLRFKAHGHADIVEQAVAASKPIESVQNVRFYFARQEIYDLAAAGNHAQMLAKLETLPFIARYYVIGNILEPGNASVTKATQDAVRVPLIEKYPYELTAFELGWKANLGVPTQLKLDTIAANYQKITASSVKPRPPG